MNTTENIYDKIQELLGKVSSNLNILEDQIDYNIQTEYFDYSKKMNNNFNPEEVLKNRHAIFDVDLPIEDKKCLMVQLASISSVEAYRTLEKYVLEPQTILKDWAKLAIQESRLLLESKFLNENQVLISTGLGGKGLSLRYFSVLLNKTGISFTGFQRNLITSELDFSIKKVFGEMESIVFDNELCSVLTIIPLKVPVQQIFDNLIAECNQYGGFLNDDYIITNVKIISTKEIRQIIRKSRKRNYKTDEV